MTGTPTATTADHAATRLATLQASPEWGRALMSGDAEANREFQELSYAAQGMAPPAPPADPPGPVGAAKELDLLLADKDRDASGRTFAERLNAGDAEARKHFDELTEQVANATDGDWATGGYVPDSHIDFDASMPRRDLVKAGNALLDRGHSRENVKALVDGQMPTPEQVRYGKHFLANGSAAAQQLFDEAAWAVSTHEGAR